MRLPDPVAFGPRVELTALGWLRNVLLNCDSC